MRRTLLGTVGMVLAYGAGALVLAPPAHAACHAFEVEVAPADPTEGAAVEVTVTRDAAVNPSSVRLRSVDGTATAGQDYEPVDQRVEFTSEVARTLTVRTLGDDVDEPDETFTLTLSEGQGCPVNTRFTYGEATVTIRDDDEPAPPASPPPPPPPTAAPTTAETTTTTVAEAADTTTSAPAPAADTSTTSTVGDAGTTTSLPSDEEAVSSEGDDSGSGPLVAIAALLALAGAGGAFAFYRLRGRPSA